MLYKQKLSFDDELKLLEIAIKDEDIHYIACMLEAYPEDSNERSKIIDKVCLLDRTCRICAVLPEIVGHITLKSDYKKREDSYYKPPLTEKEVKKLFETVLKKDKEGFYVVDFMKYRHNPQSICYPDGWKCVNVKKIREKVVEFDNPFLYIKYLRYEFDKSFFKYVLERDRSGKFLFCLEGVYLKNVGDFSSYLKGLMNYDKTGRYVIRDVLKHFKIDPFMTDRMCVIHKKEYIRKHKELIKEIEDYFLKVDKVGSKLVILYLFVEGVDKRRIYNKLPEILKRKVRKLVKDKKKYMMFGMRCGLWELSIQI